MGGLVLQVKPAGSTAATAFHLLEKYHNAKTCWRALLFLVCSELPGSEWSVAYFSLQPLLQARKAAMPVGFWVDLPLSIVSQPTDCWQAAEQLKNFQSWVKVTVTVTDNSVALLVTVVFWVDSSLWFWPVINLYWVGWSTGRRRRAEGESPGL